MAEKKVEQTQDPILADTTGVPASSPEPPDLEVRRLQAEIRKLEAETRVIENSGSRGRWVTQVVVGALVAVPLMWFYFDKIVVPQGQVAVIEQRMKNAQDRAELDAKERQLASTLKELAGQKESLQILSAELGASRQAIDEWKSKALDSESAREEFARLEDRLAEERTLLRVQAEELEARTRDFKARSERMESRLRMTETFWLDRVPSIREQLSICVRYVRNELDREGGSDASLERDLRRIREVESDLASARFRLSLELLEAATR